MNVLKPPQRLLIDPLKTHLFLAGSIDMGTAENWQANFEKDFQCDMTYKNLVILNPRRDNWDSSWKQDANNPEFRDQVEWELNAQAHSDVIAMYFSPSGKAPITLLELGLFARSKKLIVCCPELYWRQGNVQIVCERYGIEMVPTLRSLMSATHKKLMGIIANKRAIDAEHTHVK